MKSAVRLAAIVWMYITRSDYWFCRLALGLAALLFGCEQQVLTAREAAVVQTLSPIPAPVARPSNQFADRADAAALGKVLFSDAGFSVDGTHSCATCHEASRHFTDGKRVATALGEGTRNVPTVETVAWQTWFYWDGRTDSGWAQARQPLLNPLEMGSTAAGVRQRVLDAHRPEWEKVFGPVPEDPEQVLALTAKALEAFERTLTPGASRFDRYVAEVRRDGSSGLLTETEARGLKRFLSDGCVNCHNGPLFTDHSFHNIGVPQVAKGGLDAGRALGAVQVLEDPANCLGTLSDSKDCPELRYLDPSFPDWPLAFKTPTLRNVSQTAPYMHDGSIATLDGVLIFYSELPGKPLVGHRELTLEPLHLSEGARADLLAFLKTLDAEAESVTTR